MFNETDIIKRTPLESAKDRRLTPGIMAKACDIVEVPKGLLERHDDFHPTRLFHKKVDGQKEMTALRIIGLVALVDAGNERPYAVVGMNRDKPGYWQLPSTADLYFKKYDDARRQAKAMNSELGLDEKECALLALKCMARGY